MVAGNQNWVPAFAPPYPQSRVRCYDCGGSYIDGNGVAAKCGACGSYNITNESRPHPEPRKQA